MFTIETKNHKIKVKFRHVVKEMEQYPGTDCGIYVVDKNTGQTIAHSKGMTFLHKNDQYSRPFGRKLALARAIQNLIPRRYVGVRRMIWDEYFKTTNPKRGTH